VNEGSRTSGFVERVRGRLKREAAKPVLRDRAMRYPPFLGDAHEALRYHEDYVRLAMFVLALRRLDGEAIAGAIAEVGVYRGDTSIVLHRASPRRAMHLFDTFGGFPTGDLEHGTSEQEAGRFQNTSIDYVRGRMPSDANVTLHPGRVPETLSAVEAERFAFVLLDLDLYPPTVAAIEFFYPRLVPGGFLFLHDYNNPESNWACKRAMDALIEDKPESLIDMSDVFGSVVFRKAKVP
jgi:O-methyltransferase